MHQISKIFRPRRLPAPQAPRLEVDSVKALLLVTVNFDLNCQEMHKMLMDNKKLLEQIHSDDKYKHLEQE